MDQEKIKKIAYQKYQMDWLDQHGHTLADLKETRIFQKHMEEYGFQGEIWASFEEFLCMEYQDKSYMKGLLTKEEWEEYLKTV